MEPEVEGSIPSLPIVIWGFFRILGDCERSAFCLEKGTLHAMGNSRIKPRLLRGFRDYSPPEAMLLNHIVASFRDSFELFGFSPLETSAIEYEPILRSDLGVDPNKQLYLFSDLEKNPVGLRYDLTISLARFIAMNLNSIVFPFKRYQIGKVWRFDKPKRGRLREFFQLDADIIGVPPYEAELELISAFCQGFSSLGIKNFYFKVNDRRYVSSLLDKLGIEEWKATDIFRVLDKLEREGEEKVYKELTGQILLQDFDSALEYERMQEVKIPSETARQLLSSIKDSEPLLRHFGDFLNRLRQEGIEEDKVRPTASLTRGLDYYTGFVCEIALEGAESIGSIGGGGRYDDLIGKYSEKPVTGVGISLGVDRFMDALVASGMDGQYYEKFNRQSTAKVFVAVFDDSLVSESSRVARILRKNGISAELWLMPGNVKGKSLSRQFKYADRAGIPLAVVPGEEELRKDIPSVQLKDLRRGFGVEGKQEEVPLSDLVSKINALLNQ